MNMILNCNLYFLFYFLFFILFILLKIYESLIFEFGRARVVEEVERFSSKPPFGDNE